jgi:O-acetylserine/cysteine efflux transporter
MILLLVVAIWGTNFVVMKNTGDEIPPFRLDFFRFFFTLVPAVFFIKKPDVSLKNLAAYGVSIGVVQFGFLYIAVNGNISAGLASLVVQSQVLFTIALSTFINKEKISQYQILALIMAVTGLVVIGMHTDQTTTLFGLFLTLMAAVGWTIGNLVSKQAVGVNALSYIVWAAMFSTPILFFMTLYFEGADSFILNIYSMRWETWVGVLWQGWASTIFCFSVWSWLLGKYSTATVSPFALLIPVFGMLSSAMFLGESLPFWKIAAATLVIGAMLFNTFGQKFITKFKKSFDHVH